MGEWEWVAGGEEGRQYKVPLKIKREMGFRHELHAGGRI